MGCLLSFSAGQPGPGVGLADTWRMEPEVRDLLPEEVTLIADYWTTSSDEHLNSMGADPAKLPSREQFIGMLSRQLSLPLNQRTAHPLLWLIDGQPAGHCNINQIQYGNEAHMHLHLWEKTSRRRGIGTWLVKKSIPVFLRDFALKRLYCEPYALNPAPNRTLEKAGFRFVKSYVTVPGSINFEQEVNQWVFDQSMG